MNKHLNDFFNNLTESSNVLKYSLMLDYKISLDGTPDTLVSSALKTTLKNCEPIIADRNTNFFGTLAITKESFKKSAHNLAALNEYGYFDNVWNPLLKQHCLVSSYMILRKLIMQNNSLHAYSAFRYTIDCGFDYCIREGHLKTNVAGDTINVKCNTARCDSDIATSGASGYLTRLRNLHKEFCAYGLPIQLIENKEIPLASLALADALKGYTLPFRKNLRSYRTDDDTSSKKRMLSYFQSAEILQNKVYDFGNMQLLNSDKIYLQYQMEHIFHFDLLNCLLQNVIALQEHNSTIRIDSKTDSDRLIKCLYLPNTFSRKYLVQMAFDSLYDERDQKSNCITNRIKHLNEVAYIKDSSQDIIPSGSIFGNWLSLYEGFIKFFSGFVFPIYEHYFLSVLFDNVKISHPNLSAAESVLTVYQELVKVLSDDSMYKEITEFDTHISFPADIIKSDYCNTAFITQNSAQTFGHMVRSMNEIMPDISKEHLLNREYLNSHIHNNRDILLNHYLTNAIIK